MTGFDIFAIAFVLLVIATLFAGVKTVPQGYDWTIERFGKYTRTLSPGLNLIVPYFDRVGRKTNMMEQVIDIPGQEIITKDNAMISTDGVVFFQVLDGAISVENSAGAPVFSTGAIGTVAMPYFLIFEMLGPLIEVAGYMVLITSASLGWVSASTKPEDDQDAGNLPAVRPTLRAALTVPVVATVLPQYGTSMTFT